MHPSEPRAPLDLGASVRVRVATSDRHNRTPTYVQGRTGVVTRHVGRFGDPESLAYGGDGQPLRELYHVDFRMRDLWPDYDGPDEDAVEVGLYDNWLEPER